MEKSIENIWKEGFGLESVTVPRINNLYSKKSKMIIDKFRKTFQIDNVLLIPMSLAFLLGFGFNGYWALAIYGSVMLLLLFFLNRKKWKDLETITVYQNSFEYLTKFRQGLRGLCNYYTRLLGFGAPVAILPAYYFYFRETGKWQEFVETSSTTEQFIIVSFISLLLSGVGIASYRIGYYLVYRRLKLKLEELIRDLEALRN